MLNQVLTIVCLLWIADYWAPSPTQGYRRKNGHSMNRNLNFNVKRHESAGWQWLQKPISWKSPNIIFSSNIRPSWKESFGRSSSDLPFRHRTTYFQSPALWYTRNRMQRNRGRLFEVHGRIDTGAEITRCAIYDESDRECYENRCKYCCSDQYCYPQQDYELIAPDCFWGCSACRNPADCIGSSCEFNMLNGQCQIPSNTCAEIGGDHRLCRETPGCSFCCSRNTCVSETNTEQCGTGCARFCFDKIGCLRGPLKCRYAAGSNKCFPSPTKIPSKNIEDD